MVMTDVIAHVEPNVAGSTTSETIDQLCINTIRTLAMDAVQAADSGHPGTPVALAPAVYCLWQRILRFDPSHPIWPNRDRFVLSAGHASLLLYAMVHLVGTKAVNPKYETLGRLSDVPVIRNTVGRLAWKRRRARWDRGWRQVSVWPSRSAASQLAILSLSNTVLIASAGRRSAEVDLHFVKALGAEMIGDIFLNGPGLNRMNRGVG
jgi:hypothetical protein